MKTVEDCVEILAGLQGEHKIEIESSDATIMYSIARQVFKGTALTDRQYALVKEKLPKYEDQYTNLGYDIANAIENLRMPLRQIDRSKYIKIVSHSDMIGPNDIYESYKNDWKWIKVRFPFSKKLIVRIDNIVNNIDSRFYHHKKGSHEHYFYFNEMNTQEVVDALKDNEFEIQQEISDLFEQTNYIKTNPQNYVPGVYNYKLLNLEPKAVDYITSTVGTPNKDNLALFKDRQDVFGLHYFDQTALQESLNQLNVLSKKIATREKSNVLVQPSKYNLDRVAESLIELDRFPLLVVLSETNPLEELHHVHSCFKGFIEPNKSSVLFRLDNSKNSEFNEYIKNNNLNATLDKNVKIVYINNSKIPKPLLQSDWAPSTVLLLSSVRLNQKHGIYVNETDLVIHHDENMSQMMRFQKQGIQEL